jgi:hypothetical protein
MGEDDSGGTMLSMFIEGETGGILLSNLGQRRENGAQEKLRSGC